MGESREIVIVQKIGGTALKKGKKLPTEYVDIVLFDIVREFYMQRGDGAKFRTVLVGRKYFEKTLYGKVIVEKDFKKSLANLCKELPKTGIVEGLDIHVSRKDVPQYLLAGELVEAEVKGCVHLQVEKGLKETGLHTYLCPILNLIADIMEQTASSETERDTEQVSINPCQGPQGDVCLLKVLLTQALSGRYVGYRDEEGKRA
jgi:CRISPR/Cas system-associated protein endoribonuclease Cas2